MIYSAFDGLGMGLGFTFGLTCIGIVREIIGNGSVFNISIMPETYEPLTIFILAPGAFLVLAFLTALMNKLKMMKGKDTGITGDCDKLCRNCPNTLCSGKMALRKAEER